ncbi:MAG TPA: hypothetical protein VFB99_06780 [Vicinamibacterales bacterium]|jgi:hypothetical protein|nr:hypothetical protein [Vicinamibacterales bacterium]
MTKLPLYHETSSDGRGGIPGWWFGAPVVAFAYAFLAPRFVPDIVPPPQGLPEGMAPAMRWTAMRLVARILYSL